MAGMIAVSRFSALAHTPIIVSDRVSNILNVCALRVWFTGASPNSHCVSELAASNKVPIENHQIIRTYEYYPILWKCYVYSFIAIKCIQEYLEKTHYKHSSCWSKIVMADITSICVYRRHRAIESNIRYNIHQIQYFQRVARYSTVWKWIECGCQEANPLDFNYYSREYP